jgi:opacity protein-like surface antigen
MKRKEDIGTLLKKKLKGAEKIPESGLWGKISDSLDKEDRKKRRFLYFWLGGAGLGILMLLLLWSPWKTITDPALETPEITISDVSENDKEKDNADPITDNSIPEKATTDPNSDKINKTERFSSTTNNSYLEKNSGETKLVNTPGDSKSVSAGSIQDTASGTYNETTLKNVSETKSEKEAISNKESSISTTSVSEKPDNGSDKKAIQITPLKENNSEKSLAEKTTIPEMEEKINKKDTTTNFSYFNSDTEETVKSNQEEVIDSVRKAYEDRISEREKATAMRTEKRDSILKSRVATRDSLQKLRMNKRDSLSPEMEEKDSVPEAETFSMSWGISPIVAPVYFGVGADGSAIDNEFTGFDKEGSTSISYGIEVYWRILERFRLSYGFLLADFSNTTNNVPASTETERLRILNFSNTEPAALNNFLGNENSVNIYQEIRYLEMPLHLTYVFGNKDLGIQVYGGGSFYALMKDEVFAENSNGDRLSLGRTNNLSPVNISLDIGAGLYYNFSDKISLDVKPTYKYHINTVRALNFKGKTYSMGIYTGLRYTF